MIEVRICAEKRRAGGKRSKCGPSVDHPGVQSIYTKVMLFPGYMLMGFFFEEIAPNIFTGRTFVGIQLPVS
jgi:hypothetical protein